jgi:hypothetical protein
MIALIKTDKENLLRDNLILINENKELQEQINSLLSEMPEINSEKYEHLLKEMQENLVVIL